LLNSKVPIPLITFPECRTLQNVGGFHSVISITSKIPILGNFEVNLVDHFSYTINETQMDHEIGLAPSNLANMLRQMGVAGVFGYELFKLIDFYYFKEENSIALSML
jgi:hypothetical protein